MARALAAPEALTRRWLELIADPTLHDLPFKIELNAAGEIEASPASNARGWAQAWFGFELRRLLPRGEVLTSASVLTAIGVRVPEVVWASPDFIATHGFQTPLPRAPEICVEVRSPPNSEAEIDEKIRAYLTAGAQEVWMVAEDGVVRFFGADGPRERSGFGVTPVPPPIEKA
jgi:Uma2 family endonuclease